MESICASSAEPVLILAMPKAQVLKVLQANLTNTTTNSVLALGTNWIYRSAKLFSYNFKNTWTITDIEREKNSDTGIYLIIYFQQFFEF
jgi:hypothetical protein